MTTVTRLLSVDNAEEMLAVLTQNREFIGSSGPQRTEDFFTVQAQRADLESALEAYQRETMVPLAILDEDARLIGRININNITRGAAQSATVGYWVSQSHNGRGFASAALADVIDIAFKELHLHRLQADTRLEEHRHPAGAHPQRVPPVRRCPVLPEDRRTMAGHHHVPPDQPGRPMTGTALVREMMAIVRGDDKHTEAAESTTDALWVLYDRVLRLHPEAVQPRDRFYLSKGHGPMAYYATLAAKGRIDRAELYQFGAFHTILGHHPDRLKVPGVDISSGSLGHGTRPHSSGSANTHPRRRRRQAIWRRSLP